MMGDLIHADRLHNRQGHENRRRLCSRRIPQDRLGRVFHLEVGKSHREGNPEDESGPPEGPVRIVSHQRTQRHGSIERHVTRHHHCFYKSIIGNKQNISSMYVERYFIKITFAVDMYIVSSLIKIF